MEKFFLIINIENIWQFLFMKVWQYSWVKIISNNRLKWIDKNIYLNRSIFSHKIILNWNLTGNMSQKSQVCYHFFCYTYTLNKPNLLILTETWILTTVRLTQNLCFCSKKSKSHKIDLRQQNWENKIKFASCSQSPTSWLKDQ